jgi:hypothetical protein
MKTFNHFILECELRACEDEELQEGLRKRVAAAALGTALALGGGGAAKANTDISGNVNLSRGAVAAKTTDAKVKSAVSKAIDNPGQSYSASSEKGRMKTTVSGGINVSGRIGGGGDKNNNKEKKQRQKEKAERKAERRAERQADKPQPTSRKTTVEPPNRNSRRTTDPPPRPEASSRSKETRLDKRGLPFGAKNKYKTVYKMAVPTATGNKSAGATAGNTQASGPTRQTKFKAVRTNKTGGTNYVRTKIVGDPKGSGSTGNVVSLNRGNKLFSPGGRFYGKNTPSNVGKPFDSKGFNKSSSYGSGGLSSFKK